GSAGSSPHRGVRPARPSGGRCPARTGNKSARGRRTVPRGLGRFLGLSARGGLWPSSGERRRSWVTPSAPTYKGVTYTLVHILHLAGEDRVDQRESTPHSATRLLRSKAIGSSRVAAGPAWGANLATSHVMDEEPQATNRPERGYAAGVSGPLRSEERRVGQGRRSRGERQACEERGSTES